MKRDNSHGSQTDPIPEAKPLPKPEGNTHYQYPAAMIEKYKRAAWKPPYLYGRTLDYYTRYTKEGLIKVEPEEIRRVVIETVLTEHKLYFLDPQYQANIELKNNLEYLLKNVHREVGNLAKEIQNLGVVLGEWDILASKKKLKKFYKAERKREKRREKRQRGIKPYGGTNG